MTAEKHCDNVSAIDWHRYQTRTTARVTTFDVMTAGPPQTIEKTMSQRNTQICQLTSIKSTCKKSEGGVR